MDSLKKIWNEWKLIAQKIAIFQARVILAVFYFTLLLPIGLASRYFFDHLLISQPSISTWKGKTTGSQNIEELKKQF